MDENKENNKLLNFFKILLNVCVICLIITFSISGSHEPLERLGCFLSLMAIYAATWIMILKGNKHYGYK